MTLLRRIIGEKRGVIVPLLLALVANIAVYALVVYPLAVKSESSSDRAVSAAQSRQAAERDMAVIPVIPGIESGPAVLLDPHDMDLRAFLGLARRLGDGALYVRAETVGTEVTRFNALKHGLLSRGCSQFG